MTNIFIYSQDTIFNNSSCIEFETFVPTIYFYFLDGVSLTYFRVA
jgi:hypothetical protein